MRQSERQSQQTENSPTDPNLMERLIESFGNHNWKTSELHEGDKDRFHMRLSSKNRKKELSYGYKTTAEGQTSYQFALSDGWKVKFFLIQEVGKGTRSKIDHHILLPPFGGKDDEKNGKWLGGVHYWPDGQMNPLRRVKGMPHTIDMEATARAFIEQIIAGKFSEPKLIRPKSKS